MIKLLITGGTIDVEKIEPNEKYIFSETYLPKMLKQGRCKIAINSQILFMKDSLYITDADREKVVESCMNCKEKRIVITHGTDSMPKTAQVLGEKIKNKAIVLLGAIVPYNKKGSDSLFNLGCAITAVQLLPNGVYIAMNGKIFPWDNVRKNKKLDLFEKIK